MPLAKLAVASLLIVPASALAQQTQADAPSSPDDPIIVYGRELEQIGIAQSGSQGVVGYKDFEDRPISRVGELVENVPGVIATQHSGTGKANQYFLRGFNLDHGTDFAGFVDGAPVNMRTHGHGQGYLDFNFLIPELVERIDYRKGPYFSDVGDFSGAGTVAFKTWDRLPAPVIEAQVGEYGYYRGLAAGSVVTGNGGALLVGVEGTFSNGPWVLDEDLEKYNGFAKYSQGTAEHGWNVAASVYHSRWTSTDQVPERAIDSGSIDRFGFVDDDLGGKSSRYALTAQGRWGGFSANAYAIGYRLRLTSNFTYFLEDPVNGDEFQQRDRRGLFGGAASYAADFGSVSIKLGGDLRYDAIGKVGLYRSSGGRISDTVREDQVDELSAGLYAQAQITVAPGLRAIVGLRGDLYDYDVKAGLPENSGDGSDAILAPKFALAWAPVSGVELYANYGESFHSNDVRGATISIDPATGDPADRVPVLPRVRGAELGARVEQGRFTASLVGWWLKLESELVFVGDAGSTEPNDATRRYGVEATGFWRPTDWLTLDGSAAFTHARFRGVPAGLRRIPGSVGEVIAAGATVDLPNGLSGTLRVRHFGSAPLIEDGSVTSDPTTLVNLGVYYRTGPVRLGLDVFNLFDANDADITYFYESRLAGEASGVEDRHLHPVEPRQLRASVRLTF
ncbi:outer membrane receptor protein involved in Fe transport [Sphingomonas zeicaulis]|uniref:TonB-dependent receptor n=1 Tax=Sphingomonas zeicaulis TaxID=1632740 RepID=UPI003D1AB507